MTNSEYLRSLMSKRTAVKAVADIAEIVLPYGTTSLNKGYYSGVCDDSVRNMVREVRKLKAYADKYHILSAVLKDAVK